MSNIDINLTTTCNMTCSFCGSWGFNREGAHVSLDVVARALDAAAELGYTIATMTGGKPTLHPKFNDIIRMAHDRGFMTLVTTNGLRMRPEMIETFRHCRTVIRVSLHTLDPERHRVLTGAPTHHCVIGNMEKLRDAGIPFGLGCTVEETNIYEALQHADTVFIGESDLTWLQFIEDFKHGRPRKAYLPDRVVSLEGLPHLDLSLVDGPAYRSRESTINGISATRGCPNTCSFCCVRLMFDDVVRQLPAHEVAPEVAAMEDGFIMFQDDNIVGNQRYAAQLFAALEPLVREWGAQGSINVTNNDKLLKAMADSGCRSLFVGFESISEETLQILAKGKVNKARKFRDQIKKLHDHGIMIVGSSIVGIDGEPPSVFDDIYKLVDETGIEFPVVNCLTPFPSTPLYDSLKKADRIIDHNWDHYDLQHVVIMPWDQEPEQLQFKYNTLNHYLARLQRDSVFAHTASV